MLRTLLGLALLVSFPTSAAWAQAKPGGVSSELEKTSQTSPEGKLAYAKASNDEIAVAEKEVARSLEAAYKTGEAPVIECLLSRLTAIRALQSVSERAEGAMKEALADSSPGAAEKANHEFRKIAVAVSKTRMLRSEAGRCSSSDENGSSNTLVDWESFLQDYQGLWDEFDLDDLDLSGDVPEVSPFR